MGQMKKASCLKYQIVKLNRRNIEISLQQIRLLLWLLGQIEKLEAQGDERARAILGQGIEWKLTSYDDSKRASLCRTLSRLERRGLVERVAPNGRAKAIRITQLGRLIARRLKESAAR
jgi:DNA-binding PadR family transcriptional regulator